MEEAGQGRRESHSLIPQLTPAKSTPAEKVVTTQNAAIPLARPFALSLQEAFDALPSGKSDLRLPGPPSSEGRRREAVQAPVQTRRELVDELIQDLESL